ncbi:MAG: SIS domain-containing protein [Gammaproteobacteria bacterium]|nr:SIS domain-containing protein [Gammaproteobacteria bacterium]
MPAPTTDSAMYRTMHGQPEALRRVLAEGWSGAGQAADMLVGARRVYVVGIGTSYHAALTGAWLLRAAGADARAVHSFDFAHYPECLPVGAADAVIVMAHTGIKQFSSRAMERATEAGATVLSAGSLSAEHPGSRLVLRTTERESSAAYTASHLAAMTVLAQVAAELGERGDAAATRVFREAIERLPEQVADILAREEDIVPVARSAIARQIYVTGAGPNEVPALEAVIKVREAAYGRIDGLALEQFLHGPMVAFNAGDMAVIINVTGAAAGRVAEVAAALAAMDGELWLVGDAMEHVAEAAVFPLPGTLELLSPILTTVPMQLLAYHMAALKGINPDTFRRDDPRYKAAFGMLKL